MVGGNALPTRTETWREVPMVPSSGNSAHGQPLELKLKVQIGEEQQDREDLGGKSRRLDFIL